MGDFFKNKLGRRKLIKIYLQVCISTDLKKWYFRDGREKSQKTNGKRKLWVVKSVCSHGFMKDQVFMDKIVGAAVTKNKWWALQTLYDLNYLLLTIIIAIEAI